MTHGVLVVEDDAPTAEIVRETLRRLGYPLAGMVCSGEDAVQHARECEPDLVLMDVQLRGALDGVDAAREIRKDVSAPIVFLTAHWEPRTLRRATEAEPFDFLVKPFRDDQLRCAIEVALAKQRAEAAHKQQIEELRTMAVLDDLTGFCNRRGFRILVEQELKRANRLRQGRELFFADLDDLKSINDTLGHDAGDRAIRDAGTLLKLSFRASDILARLGGDEFVVMCTDGSRGHEPAVGRLEELIRSYNTLPVRPPFTLAISLGSATYEPRTPETIDALLRRADQAMYEQKLRRKIVARRAAPAWAVHRFVRGMSHSPRDGAA